jgi:hypothetical protein
MRELDTSVTANHFQTNTHTVVSGFVKSERTADYALHVDVLCFVDVDIQR